MIATESFLTDSVEDPEQNVNNRLDDEKRKNIIKNMHIVKCVSEAILFCGRQCIALHGDNEVLNGESRGNTGNFLAALQVIANHDEICMGQERLSSVVLMHIHYQVKIDLDEVVNCCHQTPTEAGVRDNLEGLVPQYFDVSYYIVKLVVYNFIQTILFEKK